MIVSRKRRFVFLHNPKVAGTSFRSEIAQYDDFGRMFWGEEVDPYLNVMVDLAHLRAWELPCVVPDLFFDLANYRTLVFVRNPMRRFLSSCFQYFGKYRGDLRFVHQDVATQRAMIIDLMRNKLTSPNVIADFQLVYFSLQRWYVFLGNRRIANHILPIFSEDQDLDAAYDILEVPRRASRRHNRSSPERYDALMCDEFVDFVNRFYAADYAMLSEFDHLQPLLDTASPE